MKKAVLMKKAVIIILTLILGFGANCLIAWLSLYLLFEASVTPIWYAAAIAVIAVFTVILCFVQRKLAKTVNGTAFVLCAQIPSFPVLLINCVFIGNVITTAAALLFVNKDKWWNEPL